MPHALPHADVLDRDHHLRHQVEEVQHRDPDDQHARRQRRRHRPAEQDRGVLGQRVAAEARTPGRPPPSARTSAAGRGRCGRSAATAARTPARNGSIATTEARRSDSSRSGGRSIGPATRSASASIATVPPLTMKVISDPPTRTSRPDATNAASATGLAISAARIEVTMSRTSPRQQIGRGWCRAAARRGRRRRRSARRAAA